MQLGALADVELWDGRITWCRGFHGGLPVWKFGEAPAGLVTPRQLREQRLRAARGQEVYGLLAWRGGRRFADLYRVDLTVPARRYTPAVAASVEAMCRAHRTCRDCGRDTGRWLPTSTWRCDDCADTTGYPAPAAVAA